MLLPVPVVRLIVTDPLGKVLILKRGSSEYKKGYWCLPGGKINYGITIEQSISKELLEETSLTCISSRFLFYQDSLPLEPGRMHCINLYFECTTSGKIVLNEESSEFTWIEEADINQYKITFRNDLGLLRYWREETRSK